MRWRILISAPYAMPAIESYRKQLNAAGCEVIVAPVRERLSEEELLSLVGDVDGVICGDDPFTERVFASAPRLKVISKWGTGIDSIDCEAALKHGVTVCNTPDAFSDAVADTVMGYALLFARELLPMDRDLRAGRWQKRLARALGECTLGVVGVGNIGKAVVERARAFGMRVMGNDIVEIPPSFVKVTGLEVASLDTLLRESDFVSLNCTLNPTSYHLIGERELGLMKPSAYLINTSRGRVINEPALIKALKARQIAGTALDVFEQEPLPPESELRRLKNCLLAPHNANASPRAWERVHENTIRNLMEGLLSAARL